MDLKTTLTSCCNHFLVWVPLPFCRQADPLPYQIKPYPALLCTKALQGSALQRFQACGITQTSFDLSFCLLEVWDLELISHLCSHPLKCGHFYWQPSAEVYLWGMCTVRHRLGALPKVGSALCRVLVSYLRIILVFFICNHIIYSFSVILTEVLPLHMLHLLTQEWLGSLCLVLQCTLSCFRWLLTLDNILLLLEYHH